MKCVLCKQRSGRRYCPGVQGDICALCCGQEREVSINCPFECSYLQQAHRYEGERLEPAPEMVHASHDVPRHFVEENERFIAGLAVTLLARALEVSSGQASATILPPVLDADLHGALDSLIRTYETLSTGLVYQTLPEGPAPLNLYRELQAFIAKWRKDESERTGMPRLRDGDVLRSLVFLRRLAETQDNRRPRGKRFLGYLRHMFPQVVARHAPSVIVPSALVP